MVKVVDGTPNERMKNRSSYYKLECHYNNVEIGDEHSSDCVTAPLLLLLAIPFGLYKKKIHATTPRLSGVSLD